ncbi:sensor histidine kinase [Alkalihalobacterium bogoriense]|uniref:sensor histidine kinase n=1 Tax=Alkalihalobacterium bogoriense TaxID=246272 RepID=UPI00047AEE24|nr:sensor histidine kinase [Alkalihalobacterium bogoriense]
MKFYKQYRIRHLLFGSFFLFMVLIFGIVIYVSYQYSVHEIIETTTEYQEKNLNLLSEDLESKLSTFEGYSIVLSRQQIYRDVIGGSNTQFGRTSSTQSLTLDFSNIVYSVPAIHSIEIFLNAPPIDNIQYPVRYYPLTDSYEEDWFSTLNDETSSWLGSRMVDTIAGEKPVISFGRHVNTSRGLLQSVLIINLDPYTLQGWLMGFSDESNLVLLDNNGNVISSTNSFFDIGDTLYQKVVEAKEKQGDAKSTYHVRHHEDFIVATAIDSVDWTLMEITPYDDLIAGSRRMTWTLIAIGIFSIMLALVGTLFLTRSVTKPVVHLANVMENYQINQPKPQLPDDYKNEFGQLYRGFDDLINRAQMLYKSLNEQNRRQREAEIKALQANINPHFLYNTLDQLNWIAIERGDNDMSKMLELLGKMLRVGLSKGESIITVEDEIKYLQYYLQIQKIQLEDRFSYDIHVPKLTDRFFIPKLTLQPFVENAIIHGFQDGRVGKVDIHIVEEGEHLLLQVLDNGIGFQTITPHKSKLNTGGYGIRNVNERLDVYFGKEASVNVVNRAEGGAAVLIRIPKVRDKDSIQHTSL